jgi:hypothetical protein
MSSESSTTSRTRPAGVTAISLFFIFGTVMSGLAAIMLLSPRTVLDDLWRVNPRAHEGFTAMGAWAILLMFVVCLACLTAAIGLWRCARWGYFAAVTILVINLTGDTVNVVMLHDWRTLIGLPVGGLMIWYLLRNRVVFR